MRPIASFKIIETRVSTNVERLLAELQRRRSQVEDGHFFICKANEFCMVVPNWEAENMIGHLLKCKARDIVPQGRTRKPVVTELTTSMSSLKTSRGDPCIHPRSENRVQKFRGNLRFLEGGPISANAGDNVFHFLSFVSIKKSKT